MTSWLRSSCPPRCRRGLLHLAGSERGDCGDGYQGHDDLLHRDSFLMLVSLKLETHVAATAGTVWGQQPLHRGIHRDEVKPVEVWLIAVKNAIA